MTKIRQTILKNNIYDLVAHTNTHPRAHPHAHTYAHTHAHAHARTHIHALTHLREYVSDVCVVCMCMYY